MQRAKDWLAQKATDQGVDLGTELDDATTFALLNGAVSDNLVKNTVVCILETHQGIQFSAVDKRKDKPYFVREVVKAAKTETKAAP